ncbi:MAG: hypothetical protein BWY96_01405 [Spirochaetes bacterium ADurb.BinA120]|nr:MAG: hypothetical protein BWY96_01405 [Spirochaetes bacterium ADurb.BinA120]
MGVDAHVERGLACADLGIGVEDEAGEFVRDIAAFSVCAANGYGLGHSVAAEESVDALGVDGDGLARLKVEAREDLERPVSVKAPFFDVGFVERVQYLVEPSEREALLEVLEV